jgi:homogentisate 1,2-dioxygenase
MPIYRQMGLIPPKRHIVFRQPNGKLYHEELFGTEGFSGMSSLVYHLNPPTMVKERGEPYSVRPKIAIEDNLQARSYLGFDLQPQEDYLDSRTVLFVNGDMTIGIAAPSKGDVRLLL